ncbi:MAG: hypothetical protein AAGJ87_00750 [Pseudomonadota bacterium]
MIGGVPAGAVAVAALIAAAGTFWFRMVLKNWLLGRDAPFRFGLYALIWLAYFMLVLILVRGATAA